MTAETRDRRVTVCSACLRAPCWQGRFYCFESRDAGTVEKSAAELRALDREHPFYWTDEANSHAR